MKFPNNHIGSENRVKTRFFCRLHTKSGLVGPCLSRDGHVTVTVCHATEEEEEKEKEYHSFFHSAKRPLWKTCFSLCNVTCNAVVTLHVTLL